MTQGVAPPPPTLPPLQVTGVSAYSATTNTTSVPPAIAVLPVGTLLRGSILLRNPHGQFVLRTDKGDLALTTDIPFKRGAELVIRMEKAQNETLARIISVDGKSLAKYVESLSQQVPDEDSIAENVFSRQQQNPSASTAKPTAAGAPLPPTTAGNVSTRMSAIMLGAMPQEEAAASVPPQVRQLLQGAQAGTQLAIKITQLTLPNTLPVTPASAQSAPAPLPPAIPPTLQAAMPPAAQPTAQPTAQPLPIPPVVTPSAPPSPAAFVPTSPVIQPSMPPSAPPPAVHTAYAAQEVARPTAPVMPAPASVTTPSTPPAIVPSPAPASPTIAAPAPLASAGAIPATAMQTPAPPAMPAPTITTPVPPTPSAPASVPSAIPATPATPAPPVAAPAPLASPSPIAAAAPAPSGILTATVLEGSATAGLTLHSPIGPLRLLSPTPLPQGTQVMFEIEYFQPPSQLPATPSAQDSAKGQHILKELVELTLPTAAPPASLDTPAPYMPHLLPRPGKEMTTELVFLLSAIKGGDIRKWLGDQHIRRMEENAPELLKQVSREFSLMRSSIGEEAEPTRWTMYQLPLQTQAGMIEPLRLYHREQEKHQSDSDEKKESGGQHFIVDVQFTRLGRLQLDGFVKKNPGSKQRFDLVVRSEKPLEAELKQGIRDIFSDAGELTGFEGGISFLAGREALFVLPSPMGTATTGSGGQSIVV